MTRMRTFFRWLLGKPATTGDPLAQALERFADATGVIVGSGGGTFGNQYDYLPLIAAGRTIGVLTVEPGLYVEGVGGVRIENLCTLIKSKARPGYLEVQPLTFSPLDLRLGADSPALDAGTALLWRGDWVNARHLLQALTKRADRRFGAARGKAPKTPAEAFSRHRQQQGLRAALLGRLLLLRLCGTAGRVTPISDQRGLFTARTCHLYCSLGVVLMVLSEPYPVRAEMWR